MIKPWRWVDRSWDCGQCAVLVDGQARDRATIWQNARDRFTWHTWDDRGTGGENSDASSLEDAKDRCVAAIVRQGWAPGGWEVLW